MEYSNGILKSMEQYERSYLSVQGHKAYSCYTTPHLLDSHEDNGCTMKKTPFLLATYCKWSLHTVNEYWSCAQDSLVTKHRRKLQLFPLSRPLQIPAIPIVGPLPRTRNGNQQIANMTCAHLKWTRARLTTSIPLTQVVRILPDHRRKPYVTP